MKSKETVDHIMEKRVYSVRPDTNLLEAANTIFEKGVPGLPVVDVDGVVRGILTEYDLITKGSALHLPTFLKIVRNVDFYQKDQSDMKHDLKKIMKLMVEDVMNHEPLLLKEGTPIEEVARVFAEHHRVNPIPVVNSTQKLIGIVSRFDIIKLYAGTNRSHRPHKLDDEVASGEVDSFIRNINRNFVLVRRSRARWWFLISIIFLIIGIVVTIFFTVRIEPNF